MYRETIIDIIGIAKSVGMYNVNRKTGLLIYISSSLLKAHDCMYVYMYDKLVLAKYNAHFLKPHELS